MAITSILRFIIRLFIIINVVSLNNDTILNVVIVSAKHVVKPLWDVSTNLSDSCILANRSDDEQLFTGSPGHACSLLINASEGTRFQLQMHGLSNDFEIDSYMDAERIDEEPGRCSDKYTVFNDLSKPCMTDIAGGDIQIILYGAASMTISGIPAVVDALPSCSEDAQATMERDNMITCKDVRRYSDMIVCGKKNNTDAIFEDLQKNVASDVATTLRIKYVEHVYGCLISFETNCDVTLHPREAAYDCRINNGEHDYSLFIPYPDGVFQNYTIDLNLLVFQNRITKLNTGWTHGLDKLLVLFLTSNSLHSLHQGVFAGSVRLETLSLIHNQISDLESGCFLGLSNLTELYLIKNLLSILHEGVFTGLISLDLLFLDFNQIWDLKPGCFHGLGNLTKLSLHNNLLNVLHEGLFSGLVNLKQLHLGSNHLSDLKPGCFEGLSNLTNLDLHYNKLTTLHGGVFTELGSLKIWTNFEMLQFVTLNHNLLSVLREGVFAGLGNLILLWLNSNQISDLNAGCFQGLNKLLLLHLFDNLLQVLQEGLFTDLITLQHLSLTSNQLSELNSECFRGLSNINILHLEKNSLSHGLRVFTELNTLNELSMSRNDISLLNSGCFQGLIELKRLFLNDNKLRTLYKDVFTDLINLERLYLINNPLTSITQAAFSYLPWTLSLHVTQHEICECLIVPKHISCNAEGIRDPYFTCDRLLSEKTLAVFTWLIGFIIIGGNLFVFISKYKENAKNKVNSTLLVNLAISDSLMGIYMLILGSADAFFSDFFPMYSSNWRSGVTCRIAGALSIISSEASVLFIMLISIDRVICIWYPFSAWKLTPKSVRILLGVTWFFATVLGIVPSVLAGTFTKFYDNSHVCIGIPLALDRFVVDIELTPINKAMCSEEWRVLFRGTLEMLGIECEPTMGEGVGSFYSTALFIGLNSLCFLVVLVCYIGIVSAVRKSAKRSKRSLRMDEQIRLTSKVTSIIATDFCCWFPIILLGILVQTRVISLSAHAFAWCVTFVLPINSALNPFVYSVPDAISQYRKDKKKRHEEQQRLEENGRNRMQLHKTSEI